MHTPSESPIVLLGSRLLSPIIMLFGLYVILHGHYSPGGGFQGGALLASSVLLVRLAVGLEIGNLQHEEKWNVPAAAVGVIIYFLTGLVAVFTGGYFLDYEALPFGLEPAKLRYYGILIIEVGIGLTVMTILVHLYDNLLNGEDRDG